MQLTGWSSPKQCDCRNRTLNHRLNKHNSNSKRACAWSSLWFKLHKTGHRYPWLRGCVTSPAQPKPRLCPKRPAEQCQSQVVRSIDHAHDCWSETRELTKRTFCSLGVLMQGLSREEINKPVWPMEQSSKHKWHAVAWAYRSWSYPSLRHRKCTGLWCLNKKRKLSSSCLSLCPLS